MGAKVSGKDRIIVALDVHTLDKVEQLVKNLAPYVGCFKVGLELITSRGGPQVVEFIHALGGKVFYDGKFDDIPHTVGRATEAIAKMGVKMFNLHASAGIEAMQLAVANAEKSLVLAVTVLTSFEENNAHLIFGGPIKAKVLQFARDAMLAGCNGIVCSPQELLMLSKQTEFGLNFLKVTPGIRASISIPDDQKRTMSAGEAIKAGADYIVVGRPIIEAKDPIEAAKRMATEIDAVLN